MLVSSICFHSSFALYLIALISFTCMQQIRANSSFIFILLQIYSNFPCYGFLDTPLFKSGHSISKYMLFYLCCAKSLPENAMASHSSTLAWKIPWMEEPGRWQSMGSLESDTTERLHFHFSLSCIREGNGNPLQCSCLENPGDGSLVGFWLWAYVCGIA